MIAAHKSSILPVWSPQGDKLAFSSSRTGSNQIWVMNRDGSDQHRVTQDDNREFFYPDWSPDGSQLAFQGLDPQRVDYDIFTAKADGSQTTQLTSNAYDEEQPQWSPDGGRILYRAKLRDGEQVEQELMTVTPDGAQTQQLTKQDPNSPWPADNFQATWSPGGDKIAFVSDRDTQPGDAGPRYDVYLMDGDGQNQHRVTDEHGDGAFSPAWSRDGQHLAYTYGQKNAEIAVINPDGSGRQVLTDLPTEDMWPEWAPDGSSIAFTSMKPNLTMEMHTVPVLGGAAASVLPKAVDERLPTFSPDGQTLAFTAKRGTRGEEVWTVGTDGSNLRRLTPQPQP